MAATPCLRRQRRQNTPPVGASPPYEVVLRQRTISGHRGIHCHGVGGFFGRL